MTKSARRVPAVEMVAEKGTAASKVVGTFAAEFTVLSTVEPYITDSATKIIIKVTSRKNAQSL